MTDLSYFVYDVPFQVQTFQCTHFYHKNITFANWIFWGPNMGLIILGLLKCINRKKILRKTNASILTYCPFCLLLWWIEIYYYLVPKMVENLLLLFHFLLSACINSFLKVKRNAKQHIPFCLIMQSTPYVKIYIFIEVFLMKSSLEEQLKKKYPLLSKKLFLEVWCVFWPSQYVIMWEITIWASTSIQTKWPVCQAKTQSSLGIGPVYSVSSLSTWWRFGSLASHKGYSEDFD